MINMVWSLYIDLQVLIKAGALITLAPRDQILHDEKQTTIHSSPGGLHILLRNNLYVSLSIKKKLYTYIVLYGDFYFRM